LHAQSAAGSATALALGLNVPATQAASAAGLPPAPLRAWRPASR
jgi:hypothetical protein